MTVEEIVRLGPTVDLIIRIAVGLGFTTGAGVIFKAWLNRRREKQEVKKITSESEKIEAETTQIVYGSTKIAVDQLRDAMDSLRAENERHVKEKNDLYAERQKERFAAVTEYEAMKTTYEERLKQKDLIIERKDAQVEEMRQKTILAIEKASESAHLAQLAQNELQLVRAQLESYLRAEGRQ